MADLPRLLNQIRDYRTRRGWSQEELARRSGLSRAGVSAIETDRLIPSTSAALALASALECRVEDLFRLRPSATFEPAWAWLPRTEICRYWSADLGGRTLRYPVEATPMGVVRHDGVYQGGAFLGEDRAELERTLVMACCDPAVGLLAEELARSADVRLIALQRSSRSALKLLEQGLVHVAGIHLARADRPSGNVEVVKRELGTGFGLLHIARWEEGIAFTPGLGFPSIREAVRADLKWIGREEGSGARQCLDELLDGRQTPRFLASDHRGVAEAVRNGWGDAGVCLRLAGEDAGLDFLGVRQETYDLCFASRWESDRRIKALIDAVRSSSYRQALGELPGYDSANAGRFEQVT